MTTFETNNIAVLIETKLYYWVHTLTGEEGKIGISNFKLHFNYINLN